MDHDDQQNIISLKLFNQLIQFIYMSTKLIRKIFRKIIVVSLALIFLIGIFNAYDSYVSLQANTCQYNEISVKQQPDVENNDFFKQSEEEVSEKQVFTKQSQNKVCYKESDSVECLPTNFKMNDVYQNFQTKQYVVLQNQLQFQIINKKTEQRFLKHKELHLKQNTSTSVKTFLKNNLFVVESKKLYIVYEIKERNIHTCLFLEKVTSNYTQHIMEYSQNELLIFSLPKRNQILLQVYDCSTNRVNKLKKIALTEWVKQYQYKHQQEKLIIKLKTAFDNKMQYVINRDLEIQQSSSVPKYESQLKDKIIDCTIIVPNYYLFGMLKEAIQNYFALVKVQIAKIYPEIRKYLKDLNFVEGRMRDIYLESIRFFYENKIIKYNSGSGKTQIISLGNHLIKTNTPVFHSFKGENLEKLESQPPKLPIYYIQNDAIHSEEYIDVYQVYPKYEVEWVGFTKTFINFYPYNKESKMIRYIRTSKGGYTFEGSKIKGKWQYDSKNQYQNYQQVTHKPRQIIKNIWEAHAVWATLFVDYHIVNNYVDTIKLVTGYNGVVVYSFDLAQSILPQFVYTTIQNNEFLISIYDSQKDESRVTKVQFYVNYLNKSPELIPIKRQYIIPSRIIQLKKVNANYIIETFSKKKLGIYIIEEKQFSNRRPNSPEQTSNKNQKSLINMQYPNFNPHIELYGIQLPNLSNSLNKIDIISSTLYQKPYAIVQEENKPIFYILDLKTLVTNQLIPFKNKARLFFSLFSMLLLPIFLFVMNLKKSIQKDIKKPVTTSKTKSPDQKKKQN